MLEVKLLKKNTRLRFLWMPNLRSNCWLKVYTFGPTFRAENSHTSRWNDQSYEKTRVVHLAIGFLVEINLQALGRVLDDRTRVGLRGYFWWHDPCGGPFRHLFLCWCGCSLHATFVDMERTTWSTASNTPWCTTVRTEFNCYCNRLQGFHSPQLHSDTQLYCLRRCTIQVGD